MLWLPFRNANERLSRAWAENEDRFIRLKADLAQADLAPVELRAERAEQLLVLIRREIEDNLMPSLAEQTIMNQAPASILLMAARELEPSLPAPSSSERTLRQPAF